jgi:hypothetical protein
VTTKERRQQWLIKKGFIKKTNKPTSFKKTEGGIVYEYPTSIANLFCGWSAQRRNNSQDYRFEDFYKQLPYDKKALIIQTTI